MKKHIIYIILFLVLAIAFNKSHAQQSAFMGCTMNQESIVNFGTSDNGAFNTYFIFDSTQSNNIWQIGKSHKPILSNFNALITDTILSYPTNNVSSFKFGIITCWGIEKIAQPYWYTTAQLYFSIESDYHKDGVVIETSRNDSNIWRNILLDPRVAISAGWGSNIYTINDTISSANKPGYSGTILEETLAIDIYSSNNVFIDTTWFKFTFYSDSIQTNKAGFSLGLVHVSALFEGINSKLAQKELEINPNPTSGIIEIKNLPQQQNTDVEIYSMLGKLLQKQSILEHGEIDISTYEPGIYLLKSGNKQKRIVKY